MVLSKKISMARLVLFCGSLDVTHESRLHVMVCQRNVCIFKLQPRFFFQTSRVKLLGTEPFGDAFGPKSTRKRPRLQVSDYGAMVDKAAEVADTHLEKAEMDSAEAHRTGADEGVRSEVRDNMFLKGQSKRIWGELFKVLDSSDVVIQVRSGSDHVIQQANFCAGPLSGLSL